MKRIYQFVLEEHLKEYSQMAFLAGPRQVGKTTIVTHLKEKFSHNKFLNWDKLEDREKILEGIAIAEGLPVEALLEKKPIIIFDEIHKYTHWKNFIKGIIDEYKEKLNIVVTGSCKLDVYRKGGDSLMGRYFLYRAHPLSVAELLRTTPSQKEISPPKKITQKDFEALIEFGGFPEPFIKQTKQFYNRWQNLRREQMIKGDIRDLSQIQEIGQLEVLSVALQSQVGQLLNYSNLAKKIRMSDQTIRRWVDVLSTYYHCFTIKPWSRNITRSLIKDPKIYLWDWSVLQDEGAKHENFIASHLWKAVQFWTDTGLGKYDLYFLRDKEKNEVDFLVTKDDQPWFIVEVKSSSKESLSKNLFYYQELTGAKHAFQVVFDLPYVEQDCFARTKPTIVPAKTFLSQLV